MSPQIVTTPGAEVSVRVTDYVIFLTVQTEQATQVVRLLADEAIDLYAALDVAIDRARAAEPRERTWEERVDDEWYLRKEMEDADRGL